ncbi:MAG: AbrB/MazE/SpoVT family DNA-binding domain-containing protein [Spirochaetales bacterium]|nr:AbrB/MazE/SpoVT family DNA-binding domain-containing protein [Spirochaetales bacterium]
MSRKTSIDSAGRLVIPKEFRDRYGFREGEPIEIIAVPDGITLIPSRSERKIVKRGRVVAIDTGAERAPTEIFAVNYIRSDQFDRKSGLSQ